MSSVEEAISYVFAWHSLSDACPKCQALNGKEWTDQDLFQEVLWDPIWGDIWNLNADHSMAHCRHASCNCRCQLEVRVIFEPNKIEELVTFQDLMRQF